MLLPQCVQDNHSRLGVCAVYVQHSSFSVVGGLIDFCPYVASLYLPVVCHLRTLRLVTLADSSGACPSGFSRPAGILDERPNVAVGPMVNSTKESGPFVFGIFDPQCLGQHRSYEDHASLAVPASLPGASHILSEDCYKELARPDLWRIIEPRYEVANSAPPILP